LSRDLAHFAATGKQQQETNSSHSGNPYCGHEKELKSPWTCVAHLQSPHVHRLNAPKNGRALPSCREGKPQL
jgi:hypothetical protein